MPNENTPVGLDVQPDENGGVYFLILAMRKNPLKNDPICVDENGETLIAAKVGMFVTVKELPKHCDELYPKYFKPALFPLMEWLRAKLGVVAAQ